MIFYLKLIYQLIHGLLLLLKCGVRVTHYIYIYINKPWGFRCWFRNVSILCWRRHREALKNGDQGRFLIKYTECCLEIGYCVEVWLKIFTCFEGVFNSVGDSNFLYTISKTFLCEKVFVHLASCWLVLDFALNSISTVALTWKLKKLHKFIKFHYIYLYYDICLQVKGVFLFFFEKLVGKK